MIGVAAERRESVTLHVAAAACDKPHRDGQQTKETGRPPASARACDAVRACRKDDRATHCAAWIRCGRPHRGLALHRRRAVCRLHPARQDRLATRSANEGKAAVLIVRIDGPKAVLFQHEAGQVVERVNAFLGYAAVGQVRIVQGPVGGSGASDRKERAPLAAAEEARLGATVAAVESERSAPPFSVSAVACSAKSAGNSRVTCQMAGGTVKPPQSNHRCRRG